MQSDDATHPEHLIISEAIDRMRRADAIVRTWLDPAFRSIDPAVPEVVGPPMRLRRRRI
ncbi:hypothetical protein [Longimicrobium sp.]|uniref:hypothetical protein n=1 Tax=Longimicrobium sp. TaxID=2029185 RepID=UPI002E36E469|nr:hypothetical protein [Longimicrobium sp.]HEX6037013.1 hypothetical protein [Longimicrobium sp.]